MAIVKKYSAEVTEIRNPLPDIFTVTFVSDKKFSFLSGQFLHLALDEYDPSMHWPESRCFSMQSKPGNNHLEITFAIKGNFTHRMATEIKVGKKVWLKLPFGDIFQRGHEKTNCVFISGGTGITPFLSLFADSGFSEYIKPILYAGFRNIEYNIFNKELELAKNSNSQFEINIIYQNRSGILDIEKIYNNCKEKNYFISGPPLMIKSFKKFLLGKNILESKIITDDWE